jgi:TM2 domain-containing membrane protein YozV
MVKNVDLVQMKQNLSPQQLEVLRSEVERRKKTTGITYLLWFFLAGLGIHKFYQGKVLQGILYIIGPGVAFLTMIIGLGGALSGDVETGSGVIGIGVIGLMVFGIWWLIDLFTIPRQIEKVNRTIESEIMDQLSSTK